MGNCLVTKLKGVVDNSNLLTLDEFKFSYKGNTSPYDSNKIALYWEPGTTDPCKVRVLGSTFTDGTTEKTFTKGTDVSCYVAKGVDCEVVISNKKDLRVLDFDLRGEFYVELKDVKHLSHLIRGVAWKPVNSTTEELATLIGYGRFGHLQFIGTGTFTGDLSALIPVASTINRMTWENTQVTGDICALINACTNGLAVSAIGIGSYHGGGIYGDPSTMNHNNVLVFVGMSSNKFTWKGTRASSLQIIGFNTGGDNLGIDFGDDLDAMLINQADCAAYTGTDARGKRIEVSGTRTAASDAAVATLKTKGYSVTINGVLL